MSKERCARKILEKLARKPYEIAFPPQVAVFLKTVRCSAARGLLPARSAGSPRRCSLRGFPYPMSWPGLSRPSTIFDLPLAKFVDARTSAGHDEPMRNRDQQLAQQLAEISVEHAVLGIGRLAARGELLEPHAKSLAHLIAGQERRLVEQRHAAPLAAELVVVMQELLPLGPAGRGRVDAQSVAPSQL